MRAGSRQPYLTRLPRAVLLRVTLVAALLLLAGGVAVAPHVDPPGRPVLHVDHVPSALRLAVLTHFARFFRVDDRAFAPAQSQALAAASGLTLALLAFRAPGVWRPGALGVVPFVAPLPSRTRPAAPAHGPPRPSFSS